MQIKKNRNRSRLSGGTNQHRRRRLRVELLEHRRLLSANGLPTLDSIADVILDEEIKKWSDMSLGMSKLAEINPFAHLKRELPKILVSFEVPRRPEHALAFAMVRC